MSAAVPFIGPALSIASSIAGAASSVAQGNAAYASASENARILSENAQRTKEAAERTEAQGLTAAARARRRGLVLRGNTLAALAASGVDPANGTPLEILSEQSKESDFQARQEKFEFDQRAWEMRVQAYDTSQRALMTLRQGSQARDAAASAAVGQLIGGAARAAGSFDLLSPSGGGGSSTSPYGGPRAPRPD